MEIEDFKSSYDSGYTNALLQLRNHLTSFIDKPNSQTKQTFMFIDLMLDLTKQDNGAK